MHSEAIDKAVAAHGMWKQRLRKAIDDGRSDFTVARVSPDNACDFGKWLYSLPPAERSAAHWVEVQALHAQFHTEAARILGLALAGKKAEAEKLLALNSTFASLSSSLTKVMMRWKAA